MHDAINFVLTILSSFVGGYCGARATTDYVAREMVKVHNQLVIARQEIAEDVFNKIKDGAE